MSGSIISEQAKAEKLLSHINRIPDEIMKTGNYSGLDLLLQAPGVSTEAGTAITLLCELQAIVSGYLGHEDPADCFCGSTSRAEGFQNQGNAIRFITRAVLKEMGYGQKEEAK